MTDDLIQELADDDLEVVSGGIYKRVTNSISILLRRISALPGQWSASIDYQRKMCEERARIYRLCIDMGYDGLTCGKEANRLDLKLSDE